MTDFDLEPLLPDNNKCKYQVIVPFIKDLQYDTRFDYIIYLNALDDIQKYLMD